MVVNKTIRRYARIWWRLVTLAFQNNSASRFEFFCYVFSKALRMLFFFAFAFALVGKNTGYAGYSKGEVLLFFAMMNVVDNGLQLIYRGLTILPRQVRTGEFDFVLTKPVSPFFWSTFSVFDFFDLTTIPITFSFLWYSVHLLPYAPSLSAWLLTLYCLVIGFILALLLNILTATASFWTPEFENGVWLYRDLSYISRFPMEVFPQGVRWFLTFVIPMFMIVAFPAKALMGRLSFDLVIASTLFTVVLGIFVRHLWKTGLSRYTSVSS